MGYPKTLNKDVFTLDEEKAAIADGCYVPGDPMLEFPKMLYKHPTSIIVNNCDEEEAAKSNGFKIKPHGAVPADEYVQGSGNERYEAGDWTKTEGEGLTDDVTPAEEPIAEEPIAE
jgi:hypothetical protein